MKEDQRRWIEHARANLAVHSFQAPPIPESTVHVAPAEITRLCRLHVETKKEKGSKWYDFGRIIPGEWDRTRRPRNPPLEESLTDLSVFQHYVEGRPWDQTPIFESKLCKIQEDGTCDGCANGSELLERYYRLDTVYSALATDGWQLEEQVGGYFEDNLSVSISRTGGFLLGSGGKHRLAIAKLLRIPTIEVYVLARHSSWQRVRDLAARGQLHFDHPDLIEINAIGE